MRQSVDHIEIDIVDAGSAEICRHGGGLLETLYPMDGALDDRIEALHTEAPPIDATIGQRIDHRVRKRARVYLDGNVSGRRDKERLPDRPNQVGKGLWRHNRRRSAAKVNVVHLDTPPDLPGYQIDFTDRKSTRLNSSHLGISYA